MSNNLAVSTIAGSAPGTSGTTFTVASGTGARFAAGKATVVKASATGFPDPTTAEIVTLPAPSGDTFTGVTRNSEAGAVSALNIAVGDWLIGSVITASMWDAVQAAIAALPGTYAPILHGHAQSDVTGLVIALAAKADAAATATALAGKADLAGGTAVALTQGGTGATTAGGARTNLGLGGAAVLSVGTTTGTVAAGDDSRIIAGAAAAAGLNLYLGQTYR